jgi:hypothetical protein
MNKGRSPERPFVYLIDTISLALSATAAVNEIYLIVVQMLSRWR